MIGVVFYIMAIVGGFLLLGMVAFYGAAILIAPFVNLYQAIREGNSRNIWIFSFVILVFALLFFLLQI